jgi:cell division protein FtsB
MTDRCLVFWLFKLIAMIIKKKKINFIGRIFSFKIFFLAGVLAVVFLGANLGKEYRRELQIQKEIDSLKNEIESFEKDNYKLSRLVELYKTEEWKEVEARKRFNMKKEGENLIIITEPDDSSGKVLSAKIDSNKSLPNYKKWWNYFFATKNNY